eukprot:5352459-Prymnesium_polylepis.1
MAKLVAHVKADKGLTGPVIAYGCSYPGALAAWLRTRYPDTVSAAIAASAPVQARVRFNALDRSVSLALDRHSPSCLSKIAATMDAVDSLLTQSEASAKRVKELFEMPSDASLAQGTFDLRYMLADTVANAVQTGQKASLCARLQSVDVEHATAESLAATWLEAAGIRGGNFQA